MSFSFLTFLIVFPRQIEVGGEKKANEPQVKGSTDEDLLLKDL